MIGEERNTFVHIVCKNRRVDWLDDMIGLDDLVVFTSIFINIWYPCCNTCFPPSHELHMYIYYYTCHVYVASIL